MSSTDQEIYPCSAGGFEYLLCDGDGTAWISRGDTAGSAVFSLPASVEVRGRTYRITTVGMSAFSGTASGLQRLVIPDSYEVVEDDAFYGLRGLRSVRCGRNLRVLDSWLSLSRSLWVHPENLSLKVSADGRCLLSRDGSALLSAVGDPSFLRVPEGVSHVGPYAISGRDRLRRLVLPGTLSRIGVGGISECRSLEELRIPGETVSIGEEGLAGNASLRKVTLPASLESIGIMALAGDDSLENLVIRGDRVLKSNGDLGLRRDCLLSVPRGMVPGYRAHPVWGWFVHIDAICHV